MTAPAPSTGDVIAGKYRVERPLGEGGMAVVYAATHLALGRPVALKFVRPWALGENEARQRFLREAHATFSLRSEHAVRMLDLGELPGGDLFLVMELLEGQNLSELIQKRGPLPEAEAARLIRQACDALAEAHALGIVHRDLKPANLFVTSTATGKSCLKVLDFGLAKISGTVGPGSMAPLTNIATTLGTPKYMAPEQWERATRVDGRADIYSLGVILFQLLTGKVPHEELPLDERVRMILAGAVPSPRALRPEVSEAMARTVMRCLRPIPDERFRTAQELADALAYAEAGPAVSRPPPMALNATGITAVVPDAVRRAVNHEVDVKLGHASAAAASVSPDQLMASPPRAAGVDDGDAPPTRIGAPAAPPAAPPRVATTPMAAWPPGADYTPESVRTEKMDRPAFLQPGQGDPPLQQTLMSGQAPPGVQLPPMSVPRPQAPLPASSPHVAAYAAAQQSGRTTQPGARTRPPEKKSGGAGLAIALALGGIVVVGIGGALAYLGFRARAAATADTAAAASASASASSAAPVLAVTASAEPVPALVPANATNAVKKHPSPTHATTDAGASAAAAAAPVADNATAAPSAAQPSTPPAAPPPGAAATPQATTATTTTVATATAPASPPAQGPAAARTTATSPPKKGNGNGSGNGGNPHSLGF